MNSENQNSDLSKNKKVSSNVIIPSKSPNIFSKLPLFTKYYFLITIILYILNLKLPFISYYLINIPSFTIMKFQIWRLITSVFISTNILQIILAFLVWFRYASMLEKLSGTVKYAIYFFINSICIQIIKILLFSFFSLCNLNSFTQSIKSKNNNGVGGIIMCDMILLCLCNPDSPLKLFFLRLTKIYTIILVLMFLFANCFEIDADIISGVIHGHIYFYFLRTKLSISDSLVIKFEHHRNLNWLKNIKGFISIVNAKNEMTALINENSTDLNNENTFEKSKKVEKIDKKEVIESDVMNESSIMNYAFNDFSGFIDTIKKSNNDIVDDIYDEYSIKVFVRIRPLIKTELEKSKDKGVDVLTQDSLLAQRHVFFFDRIFDISVSQEILFQNTIKELLPRIIEGFKVAAFAYGAKYSGKTYTMLGTKNNKGLMINAIFEILQLLKKKNNKNLKMKISFIEAHNEILRDLLSKGNIIEVQEQEGGVVLKDVKEIGPEVCDIISILSSGNNYRTKSHSNINLISSNSHGILRIQLYNKDKRISGQLIMVDLACSENNIYNSEINEIKSLLNLKVCINEFSSKNIFIPWEKSKLTMILNDCFKDEKSKFVWITTISPSKYNIDETVNNLFYSEKIEEGQSIKKNKINGNNCSDNKNIFNYSSRLNINNNMNNLNINKDIEEEANKGKIIAVNFISIDQLIHYPVPCNISDNFTKLEEQLFEEFPELKNKNIFFIANGGVIDRNATIAENNIKKGTNILINYA